jgi:hypothetical protein
MGGGGGWRGKKNLMHNFPKQLGEGVPIWGSWGGWVGGGGDAHPHPHLHRHSSCMDPDRESIA